MPKRKHKQIKKIKMDKEGEKEKAKKKIRKKTRKEVEILKNPSS